MDKTFTLRIKARWVRIAALVAVTALVALPTAAVAGHRFVDVPDTNIFHDDIEAIALAGVTAGCGANIYCPNANVTRGQMAAFMNRLGALAGQTPVVNAKTALTAASAANADTLDGLDSTDFLKVGEGGGGDADTLDGLDSTAFLLTTGKAADSDKLDGLDSTAFVGQGEADSVTSAMTTNEPGVAQSVDTAATSLGSAFVSVDSVSITVPTSGYVIVMGSMQAKALHAAGTETHLTIDVSTSSSSLPDPANTKNFVVPGVAASGNYTTVASVQRAFPVTAGAHTFHLIANEVSGEGEIDDVTLTAWFVPTAYGTVSQ